ncbi:hypothetical protein QOZ80_5AG0393820 [Eleusine coracana subsp. coracana]|nr:hypothetical protein QOZ80_5AG0393820 [Eleusine coracana subsp. coracana]
MAMVAEIQWYQSEVEAPAYALLRDRKASHPSTVRKEPYASSSTSSYHHPAFFFSDDDLDDVEPHFPDPLAAAPIVTSMALRVSWPPNHQLLSHPNGSFISSCHNNFLALYSLLRWAVLSRVAFTRVLPRLQHIAQLDHRDSAAALVLRVSYMSHAGIGTGVAILQHGDHYVLAELLLNKDDRSHLTSNKATLFLWRSSGPGQWVHKEVLLSLPESSSPEEQTSFHADMVFAAGTSLCWVDLLTGILICDNAHKLDTGLPDDDDAAGASFRFVPLPEECAMKPDPRLSRHGRGQPEEYRSMCCIDRDEAFVFVSMDGYGQGRPAGEAMLATWTLNRPMEKDWAWEKGEASFRVSDLWNDPIYKDELKLQPLAPCFPVISALRRGVIYLLVADYVCKNGRVEPLGFYVISLDVCRQRVTSAFKFPSPSQGGVVPRPRIFAAQFSNQLNQ